MNVIFMGTPEFAVPTLKALLESTVHKVVAVFSQKPKAQGRGMKIAESPIHRLAISCNLPVYTPSTLKNEEATHLIRSIEADVIVITAYGFIITKPILQAKKYGCLNIHPSDLPKYRGAAPLQRAIINGENKTAVCVIQMDEGLDTGDIIIKKELVISNKITFTELHDKTSKIGANMLIQVLDNIDKMVPFKQSEEGISYAHKLSKDESKVNWYEPAFSIDCKVRGMAPWPGIYFEYQGKKVKITKAEPIMVEHKYAPGTLLDFNNKLCEIACGKGILRIIELQPEGKKTMDAKAYLRGLDNKSKAIKFA